MQNIIFKIKCMRVTLASNNERNLKLNKLKGFHIYRCEDNIIQISPLSN